MLSLSPRFDLFKFQIPKDWFPQEIIDKYNTIICNTPGVFKDSVAYVNESIQGITISGLSELTAKQLQTATNANSLGRLKMNREPVFENNYKNTVNPLVNCERILTVTMRQNQGLYNYFMMYESIFHHICKHTNFDKGEDVFKVYICNEKGIPSSAITLYQPLVSSIDGLEFNTNRAERESETFNVTFDFNNIDFEFV